MEEEESGGIKLVNTLMKMENKIQKIITNFYGESDRPFHEIFSKNKVGYNIRFVHEINTKFNVDIPYYEFRDCIVVTDIVQKVEKMTKKITIPQDCPICEKPLTDSKKLADINNQNGILAKYPIVDDIWPSRRWNQDMTEHIDLSGNLPICSECYTKRTTSTDVNVDGHVLCSKRGCGNDSNEFSKYCNNCYSEAYQR